MREVESHDSAHLDVLSPASGQKKLRVPPEPMQVWKYVLRLFLFDLRAIRQPDLHGQVIVGPDAEVSKHIHIPCFVCQKSVVFLAMQSNKTSNKASATRFLWPFQTMVSELLAQGAKPEAVLCLSRCSISLLTTTNFSVASVARKSISLRVSVPRLDEPDQKPVT